MFLTSKTVRKDELTTMDHNMDFEASSNFKEYFESYKEYNQPGKNTCQFQPKSTYVK